MRTVLIGGIALLMVVWIAVALADVGAVSMPMIPLISHTLTNARWLG